MNDDFSIFVNHRNVFLMPKYTINEEESHLHGDAFQLEQHTYFSIVETESQKPVKVIVGNHTASYDDGAWTNEKYSGVYKVEISEDETLVTVFYTNPEKIETIKL
jgi:hypothetical protein